MKKFKARKDRREKEGPKKVSIKNAPKSRKELRKEKRKLKKIHKNDYFSKKIKSSDNEVGKFVRPPVSDDDDKPDDSNNVGQKSKNKKQEKIPQFDNLVINEIKGAKRREDKLKEEMKKQYDTQLIEANREEDKIIKKLEKQLKMNKRKPGNIARSFMDDGLDYLLEVCDSSTMAAAITAEKHLTQEEVGSDFEEDVALATGKISTIKSNKKKESSTKVFESDDSVSEGDFDDEFDGSDFDDPSSDEESIKKEVVAKKINQKQKKTSIKVKKIQNLSDDYDDEEEDVSEEEEENISNDEEENMSDGEEEDMSEDEAVMFDDDADDDDDEELSDLGLGEFPDDSFIPGKYPAIIEETESDVELYANNISITQKHAIKKHKINECEERMSEDEDQDEEDINESDEEMLSEDESECSDPECSNPRCGVPEACNGIEECCPWDDDEDDKTENKIITVNGKKVNTHGRFYMKETEPDLIRCPKLDKILDTISDSETESKSSKTYTISPLSDGKSKSSKKVKSKKTSHPSKKMKLSEKEKALDDSDDSDQFSDNDESMDSDEETEGKEDGSWEDIYGRKRDKDGNIVVPKSDKYVPPHMREKLNQEDEKKMIQLKRQIKGLLNKVAGSNMHWTSSQLENIYSTNSRNSVNSAFCSLWMSAIVQETVTSDRMACEHAMLVAILHANIGSEVGAYFLQTLVKKFNELSQEEHLLEDKSLDNLMLGLSELYSFKIFHSSLLYEILKKLIEKLSEKSIDCLLVCLRSVGAVLRKDDPAALKVFIQTIQSRASELKDNPTAGARVKFLLDVLLAIKNNNINKIPNYDPTYSEELKKALKGIVRKGNYIVPLNIKLEDLLKADERGRWWIVGSAWEGSSADKMDDKREKSNKPEVSQKILKLASKLRINTELRRKIFCIIMSAEDYMDAFEKLQQLGLKNQQEREIIHILMLCCLQEKKYNPYYSTLAQRFCDYDRKFQMFIQYSVWDKLKELDNYTGFQISNLAQFLIHLFVAKGLPISILKVVQFSDLKNSTLRLIRQILLSLLLQKKHETCLEVFQRAALSPKLHLFRESLRLFISHFLVKNLDKKENILDEKQLELLKERASAVENLLSEAKSKY